MAILDVQRRYRELGRLRLGQRRHKDGKVYPVRLATWRFTSPDQRLLDAAANLWGGEVREWADAPTEGEQWEVVTEATELNVYVPPQDLAESMFYELWSRGGVKRRCNGITEFITGGDCICEREGRRACTVTTHLAVVLPQIPDVGVWRVRTNSWNAAAELPSTVELLRRIHEDGALPLAVLGIESRTKVAEGQTRHFTLPVLRFPSTIAAAEAAGIPILSRRREAAALQAGEGQPDLPPDARFDRDVAEWGEAPEIPSPAPEDQGTAEADIAAAPEIQPAGTPPPSSQKVEGRADVASVPASPGGAGPETAAGPGRPSQNAAGGSGPTTGEPEVGEPDPFAAYQSAVRGDPEALAAARRAAISARWGWPPVANWPADRLRALEEIAEATR